MKYFIPHLFYLNMHHDLLLIITYLFLKLSSQLGYSVSLTINFICILFLFMLEFIYFILFYPLVILISLQIRIHPARGTGTFVYVSLTYFAYYFRSHDDSDYISIIKCFEVLFPLRI